MVDDSSIEEEYHAITNTTSKLFSLRQLLKDLGMSTFFATSLYCDKQIAI